MITAILKSILKINVIHFFLPLQVVCALIEAVESFLLRLTDLG